MGVGSGAPAGGPRPASRAAVEALPTVEIGAAHADKSCAICCEPFVPETKGLPPLFRSFPLVYVVLVRVTCHLTAVVSVHLQCWSCRARTSTARRASSRGCARAIHAPSAGTSSKPRQVRPPTNAAPKHKKPAASTWWLSWWSGLGGVQQRSRRRRGLRKERRKHPAFSIRIRFEILSRRIRVQAGAGSDAARSGWGCWRRWAGQHHYLPDGRRRRQVCRGPSHSLLCASQEVESCANGLRVGSGVLRRPGTAQPRIVFGPPPGHALPGTPNRPFIRQRFSS